MPQIKIIIIALFLIYFSNNSVAENKNKVNISPSSCVKISKPSASLAYLVQKAPPNMIWIPPGKFMMGGNDKKMKFDELPRHLVKLSGFYMDTTEVTNKAFKKFVAQTGYVTTAEKSVNWELLKKQLPLNTPKPSNEKLKPGSLVFSPSGYIINLDEPNQWWKWIIGANWLHPLGPKSYQLGDNHPVVQVSWEDANAYCKWVKKRLPTEAQWEWAARGGLTGKVYPWGNEDIEAGKAKANTWQGNFPNLNTLKDGYYWTSPVKAFPPNNYGLYDMAGNVWEWTADFYNINYYMFLKKQGLSVNPQGAVTSFDPDEPEAKKYVLRGGSFLCNKNYCAGYRVSARMKSTPDTSLVNVGFRCVSN